MPDPIDERLVSGLVQSDYFRYLVDQEVAKRTEEKLSAWWKKVAAITGIILGVFSLIGIRELLSLHAAKAHVESMEKQINSKVEDINKQIENNRAMLAEMGIALKEAQGLSGIASRTLEGSQEMNRESLRLMGGASAIFAESRLAIESSLTRQQQIASSTEQSLKELDTSQSRLNGELDRIEGTRKSVEETGKKVEEDAQKIGGLLKLRADLEKAKTFTYFMLENHSAQEVEVGGKRISFSVKKISQPFTLWIYVKGQTGDSQEVKDLMQGREFLIAGTENLYCEVVATRYKRVGPDFALFKVFAR